MGLILILVCTGTTDFINITADVYLQNCIQDQA